MELRPYERIWAEAQSARSFQKQLMQKKAGGIAQLVEHLTRNYEFLNTNPSTKTITRN
jgi:hypothetical protein